MRRRFQGFRVQGDGSQLLTCESYSQAVASRLGNRSLMDMMAMMLT